MLWLNAKMFEIKTSKVKGKFIGRIIKRGKGYVRWIKMGRSCLPVEVRELLLQLKISENIHR